MATAENEIPRKKAVFKKWIPRRWKPEYEQIVLLSMNATNGEISVITGYTKQQISNILNTPQAIEIKEKLILKMRERAVDESPISLLNHIRDKTLKRLNEALENDDLMKTSPFALIDRGLEVVKGLGHLNKGAQQPSGGINNFNGPVAILPSEAANQLVAGLELANKVREKSEGRQLSSGSIKIQENKDDNTNT